MNDDDQAPDTVRLPESGPFVRLPPDELRRRHELANQMIAEGEASECAQSVE